MPEWIEIPDGGRTGRVRIDRRASTSPLPTIVLVGGMTQTLASWGAQLRPLSERGSTRWAPTLIVKSCASALPLSASSATAAKLRIRMLVAPCSVRDGASSQPRAAGPLIWIKPGAAAGFAAAFCPKRAAAHAGEFRAAASFPRIPPPACPEAAIAVLTAAVAMQVVAP